MFFCPVASWKEWSDLRLQFTGFSVGWSWQLPGIHLSPRQCHKSPYIFPKAHLPNCRRDKEKGPLSYRINYWKTFWSLKYCPIFPPIWGNEPCKSALFLWEDRVGVAWHNCAFQGRIPHVYSRLSHINILKEKLLPQLLERQREMQNWSFVSFECKCKCIIT